MLTAVKYRIYPNKNQSILINKTNFEQHEIKGDGKMIKGIWYFIPEDASLNDARKEFKVWF